MDAAAGDYRLDGLSPLVDAGELEAAMGLVLDLSGSPRLVDSDGDGEPLPDLGAFESQASDGAFLRGDTDTDGVVQLDDAVSALNFLFLGAAEPSCLDAVDADDNGLVELADAVRILGFLFLGSPPPPAPGAFVCGADPTADVTPGGDLGCKSFAACP